MYVPCGYHYQLLFFWMISVGFFPDSASLLGCSLCVSLFLGVSETGALRRSLSLPSLLIFSRFGGVIAAGCLGWWLPPPAFFTFGLWNEGRLNRLHRISSGVHWAHTPASNSWGDGESPFLSSIEDGSSILPRGLAWLCAVDGLMGVLFLVFVTFDAPTLSPLLHYVGMSPRLHRAWVLRAPRLMSPSKGRYGFTFLVSSSSCCPEVFFSTGVSRCFIKCVPPCCE